MSKEEVTPIEIVETHRVGRLITGELVIVRVDDGGLMQTCSEPPYLHCWARMEAGGEFEAVKDERSASWGFLTRSVAVNNAAQRHELSVGLAAARGKTAAARLESLALEQKET